MAEGVMAVSWRPIFGLKICTQIGHIISITQNAHAVNHYFSINYTTSFNKFQQVSGNFKNGGL